MANSKAPRHAAVVRITHWLTVITFFALLISGCEMVVPHPRFYWGETGNVMERPLFTLPIPASRHTVPTRYSVVLEDQNGWSRSLHFQAAWLAVLTGLVYVAFLLWSRHLRDDLLPAPADRKWQAYRDVIAKYLRRAPPDEAEAHSYNVMQRIAYLGVIFVLFPMMIWTGLAMSPAFTSALPFTVTLLGGRQTARTLHFFLTWALMAFVVAHVTMVAMAGFWSRVRAMITGHVAAPKSGPAMTAPIARVSTTGQIGERA